MKDNTRSHSMTHHAFGKYYELTLQKTTYKNGGTALQLMDAEDGFPYAMATVWIEGLAEDEVAIKNYSENEGILETLIDAGIVEKPHRLVSSGFVNIPVCRLK